MFTITIAGKKYKFRFYSNFIEKLDVETTTLIEKLLKRLSPDYNTVSKVAELLADVITNLKKDKEDISKINYNEVSLQLTRNTGVVLYCYEDDAEIGQAVAVQSLGDADDKLLGKKVALKKLLAKSQFTKTERDLIWNEFFKNFK